jgi:N-acetyl-gamma-glutamyl-phosphate reductase/acetylglutamate kinase
MIIAHPTNSTFNLKELYGRSSIRTAKRISNPGCYATSSQLLIAPLINHLKPGSLPTVFGISGYSGAGTVLENDVESGKPITKPKMSPKSLDGGVKAYALTGHIHEKEAGYHLSTLREDGEAVKVAFVPSVATWFSGILSTVSVPLNRKMTAKEVVELFEERYKGEMLVKIQKEVVQLGDVEGRHGWTVGGFQMSVEGDRVVIVVCPFFFFDRLEERFFLNRFFDRVDLIIY